MSKRMTRREAMGHAARGAAAIGLGAAAFHLIRKADGQIVWQIEYLLNEDVARPIIYHDRAATCWQPQVKAYTQHGNSIYNGWRFEDVWLDK